jgi:hypothetical protein
VLSPNRQAIDKGADFAHYIGLVGAEHVMGRVGNPHHVRLRHTTLECGDLREHLGESDRVDARAGRRVARRV